MSGSAAPAEEPAAEPTPAPLALTKAEERGRDLFLHYCAHCHGPAGRGDGLNAYGMEVQPRDLLSDTVQKERSDEQLARVVTGGGPAGGFSRFMPPWGRVLDDERVADLVAFLQALPELEPFLTPAPEAPSLEEEAAPISDFTH